LLGESKSRNYRKLDRIEETTTDDTTTPLFRKRQPDTERFELKSESDKTIKSDMSFKAGVTVSGKFGPVEISSNASFAANSSQEESIKNTNDLRKMWWIVPYPVFKHR